MSDELGSVIFAVLHQLANSLTAAEGYGSLLGSASGTGEPAKSRPTPAAVNGLQQSLTQAQILLQALEAARRLLYQQAITQQPVVLETVLTAQLAELKWLLSRRHIQAKPQRIYQAPAVLTDPHYAAELIRLMLYNFILAGTQRTMIQLTITARRDDVRLGFALEAAQSSRSKAGSKAKSKPRLKTEPTGGQAAILRLIDGLAARAQIQFSPRSDQFYLIFPRARQLPLIAESQV